MAVGRKIYKLREERKMSQTELAHLLDVFQTTLHNIESENSKKIDFALMDKVCKIFDKDFSYFTDDTVFNNNVTGEKATVALINGQNHGTVNMCPENFSEEMRKIIEDNKKKEDRIEILEKEIEFLKKLSKE